ncbi:MAG: hypothetical protein LH609_09365, partial [Rudanella sp.]|nr:hypothetical protein [Rudanella sp.]
LHMEKLIYKYAGGAKRGPAAFGLLLALMLLGSAANAQVKIGANAKTIGSSSNLEVEAANGKKTIVDKATGQVTIQDGTEGAGKVLTSDANGGSSWKSQGGQTGTGFDSYLTPSAAFNINYGTPSVNVFPFPDVTISEAGTYMAIVRTFGTASVSAAPLAFYSFIRKNGSTTGQDTFEWYAISGAAGANFGVAGTLVFTANVGDVVTVGFVNGYSTNPNLTISTTFLPRNNVRFIKIR